MNMTTVPRPLSGDAVPLADVIALLDAVQAVLDLPKHGTPDDVVLRLAHTSGVLSAAVDQRSINIATDIINRTATAETLGDSDHTVCPGPGHVSAPDYPTVDHTRPRNYGRTASVWKSDVLHCRENPENVDAFDDRSLCGINLFVATIVPEEGRLCARCDRIATASRTPYDADHVAYVHEAGEVHALYIPDPEHARNPKATWVKCRNIAWWRTSGVECIGSVVRDGRRWRWEGPAGLDPFPDGEPTTKRQALPGLRSAVVAHFERAEGNQ